MPRSSTTLPYSCKACMQARESNARSQIAMDHIPTFPCKGHPSLGNIPFAQTRFFASSLSYQRSQKPQQAFISSSRVISILPTYHDTSCLAAVDFTGCLFSVSKCQNYKFSLVCLLLALCNSAWATILCANNSTLKALTSSRQELSVDLNNPDLIDLACIHIVQ